MWATQAIGRRLGRQVLQWFSTLPDDGGEGSGGGEDVDGEAQPCLHVCRIKNGFASPAAEGGYRDLKLYVLLRSRRAPGLRIIGEIQIHDDRLHYLKLVNVSGPTCPRRGVAPVVASARILSRSRAAGGTPGPGPARRSDPGAVLWRRRRLSFPLCRLHG